MNLLTKLYNEAILAERELGLTQTPRLSTPILKERVRAGEKLKVQYSYGDAWGLDPLSPLEARYLRLAEPEKPAEWKAGGYLKYFRHHDGCIVRFIGDGNDEAQFQAMMVQQGVAITPERGEVSCTFCREDFRPYTPTPEERIRFDRIVANAKLKAEWEKEPFLVQWRRVGERAWNKDSMVRPWTEIDKIEYRRKPAPSFVPWTAEDAEEFRGMWVRTKSDHLSSFQITSVTSDNYVSLGSLSAHSLEFLLSQFEQLDGTPCGKEVAE